MRVCHVLALTSLVICISNNSTVHGSVAARAQAAAAAPQTSPSSTTTPADRGFPALNMPQSDDGEGASHQRIARPTIASPAPPAHSGRVNVADWLNMHSPQETRGATNVAQSREPVLRQAAGTDHRASAQVSSRRQAITRSTPADQPLAPQEPLTISDPRGVGELVESSWMGTTAGSVISSEPATLSAADGKLIELEDDEDAPRLLSNQHLDAAQSREKGEVAEETQSPPVQNREQETGVVEGEDEEEEAEQQAAPPTRPKQHSPELIRLRDRIRACMAHYYQRPENVAKRSPWGVMHSLIAFGVDTEVQAGNDRLNAIGWLCYNRPCYGMQLLQLEDGRVAPKMGPGYQGHEGQFLSMLALSRVKATYPIRVDGQEFTVQDLIEYEKWTCRPKSELTFKLIGLAHYLPSDATWTSKWGEEWSIPRLIREELDQPINGACCGGTHRLIGYSMAVKVRRKRGEPLDGQWLRADKFVDAYHKYAIKLQNRDGSFSTSWLKHRDDSGELDRRIQTTGHILEWLIFSLPDEELTDPRIVSAVNYLNNILLTKRSSETEIGPRGHALRALALYNERVFGDKPGTRKPLLARRPQK